MRDTLLVSLALKSGLRRAELANLAVKDIHTDFLLVVRSGKGDKDRAIPLLPDIAIRLHNFTREMKPDGKVFNLKATSIGNKIRRFAQKAVGSLNTMSAQMHTYHPVTAFDTCKIVQVI